MTNVINMICDGLENLVSRMGTGRDKAAHSAYVGAFLSDQEVINAYRGAWLPRKIVDIPAMDSCRKWRNWQAEEDQITAIEAAQRSGTVRSDRPAGEILALVLTLANMWQHRTEDVSHLVTDAQRRTIITDAVRRLVAPEESPRG